MIKAKAGYESDDQEEKYGIEGLIAELTDLTIDILENRSILQALKNDLTTFLLCIKGYCLMPNNSIKLWRNDMNLYISEEYDEENVNSIRNKALSLIKVFIAYDSKSLIKLKMSLSSNS